MRAVAQRVSRASVHVDGEGVAHIGHGLLVYLGAGREDTSDDVRYVADKLAGLRIFEDASGRMARSVTDVQGGLLLVSQFTLYGDVRRGRRPSFDAAAEPERARHLCDDVGSRLATHHGLSVRTGRFGAMMDVRSEVDGPVTILVDSQKLF